MKICVMLLLHILTVHWIDYYVVAVTILVIFHLNFRLSRLFLDATCHGHVVLESVSHILASSFSMISPLTLLLNLMMPNPASLL